MNIRFFLHSTTGNTRLVTRYAAGFLAEQGHHCEIHDIVRRPAPPDLGDVDLLGVAAPTMYFRATVAMERFVARLPSLGEGRRRPAFLLATCMGEPGAHFALLAEELASQGWVTLGAHWVLARSNWPTHLAAIRPLAFSSPLGRLCAHLSASPLYRGLLGSFWEDAGKPLARDRRALDAFLTTMVREAAAGAMDDAPAPDRLHGALPFTVLSGRRFPVEWLHAFTGIRIDGGRCTRCGNCVRVCPVGVIAQSNKDEVPTVAPAGCTGCYACYNHCTDGAIGALGISQGRGRYGGPPREMREIFRAPGPEE